MSDIGEIRMQVMWNRLISVVEEQALTLLRTAFSTSVRESGDLSAGVFDPASGAMQQSAIIERATLATGDRVVGPAVIVERETSTVVTGLFDAVLQSDGSILLIRKGLSA